jgi:hypothetical protein
MTTTKAANNKITTTKNANETIMTMKRELNKINSLASALQLEHSISDRTTAMRFAAISDEIMIPRKVLII